jgi:hypothetical protein
MGAPENQMGTILDFLKWIVDPLIAFSISIGLFIILLFRFPDSFGLERFRHEWAWAASSTAIVSFCFGVLHLGRSIWNYITPRLALRRIICDLIDGLHPDETQELAAAVLTRTQTLTLYRNSNVARSLLHKALVKDAGENVLGATTVLVIPVEIWRILKSKSALIEAKAKQK